MTFFYFREAWIDKAEKSSVYYNQIHNYYTLNAESKLLLIIIESATYVLKNFKRNMMQY